MRGEVDNNTFLFSTINLTHVNVHYIFYVTRFERQMCKLKEQWKDEISLISNSEITK